MNLGSVLWVVTCLLAATCANPSKSYIFKPSKWLTSSELESIPSLDEITFNKLEQIPVEKGAELMHKWYHISQINYQLKPSFVPNLKDIPVYIVKSNGNKETSNLNDFVKVAKQDNSLGDGVVIVFITGLPSTIEPVKKANHKLIQGYIERSSRNEENTKSYSKYKDESSSHGSSEENSSEWNNEKSTKVILIVIDLGHIIDSLEHLVTLNVDETGALVSKALVQLTNDCHLPQEIIHVLAQGVAAHVAGAAGDKYTRLTGHKLRRITALDPSKIFAKDPQVLTGLARGDADFVDAIHTSAYGMGTINRVGDIDFFPSGPCAGAPGTENVLEASMRATLYFAESVRPGNEHNFPAVKANSLKQHKSDNSCGKRAFMGIATDYDLKGDFVLEVNENSPFGMKTLTHKQNNYHGDYKDWHH